MKTKNKLIVALDVKTAAEAQRLIDMLRGIAGMFKIGSQLFTATGPEFVRNIVDSGERVFLDLKFHDIPNTVAAAGVEAARLGVAIFNVHAAGGMEMMRRTAEAVAESTQAEGILKPSVIGVTVLTSTDQTTLAEVGWSLNPESLVQRLALLAESAGLDGVVASPREIGIVRSAVEKPGFIVVTPGVRPQGADLGDQSRVTTPAEAVAAGADYLVVGRPIIDAPDPAKAAWQIVEEMETSSTNAIG
ncbi:MAG TPA: orotidine-5'-phosphate decarboxylase [Pyrinomonadaceae bacterium]|nr:orotidine-5'-phosphate decarboxylase [Pyrinomonadaceae bacterium]